MAVDIEELIITPFRELVEAGKEAVQNAEAAAEEDEETSKAMAKAAKAVVKEGERALKRLQPLWDSQVEKYGEVFKAAMAKNEEIEEKRRKLEDLLYDFEDYTEIDSFEEERFAEVQAAAKSLALDVLDIIKRLKIDGLPISPPPKQPSFPPLPPLPPLPPSAIMPGRPPSNSSQKPLMRGKDSAPSRPEVPMRSAKRLSIDGGRRASPELKRPSQQHQGLARSDTKVSRASSNVSIDTLPPYGSGRDSSMIPPPLEVVKSAETQNVNIPQRAPQQPAVHGLVAAHPLQRRPSRPNILGNDGLPVRLISEPISPATTMRTERTEGSSIVDIPTFPLPRTTAWVSDQVASSPAASPRGTNVRVAPPLALMIRDTLRETPIPEHEAVTAVSTTSTSAFSSSNSNHDVFNFEHPSPSVLSKLSRFSVEASIAANSSFDPSPLLEPHGGPVGALPSRTATTATSRSRRTSAVSSPSNSAASTAPSSANLPPVSNKSVNAPSPASPTSPPDGPVARSIRERESSLAALTRSETGLSPLSLPSAAELDDGLMLADDWRTVVSDGGVSSSNSARGTREADCSIGPKSSLYQMKGFCEGAQGYKSGGHWQGVRKTSGYVAGQTSAIGRCIGCGYAHHYDELSLDVDRDPKANFTNAGIRFRIRFLYKSHLITHKMAEAYYACLFCAQAGSTVREGDATVFPSSDALFRHLARHRQPLPDVPGLTVLYGTEFDPADRRVNDFDVHFVEPCAPGAGSGIPDAVLPELAKLPVATAVKPHVQRFGEKKLARPDGMGTDKELLQFFVGARLVGVEFPVRWGGKWATAWHDGAWGVFPAKSIELEKPRRHEVPPMVQTNNSHGSGLGAQSGMSSVSAVARWKFEPKDAAANGWLVFDKGDTIRNVGFLYKDHWCWSGTGPKGKVGLFPRAYVMYDDVKEEFAARPGTSRSGKTAKGKGKSLFSRGKGLLSDSASSLSGGSGVVEIISR